VKVKHAHDSLLEANLLKNTNKILENLAEPKQYFELIRVLEAKGLAGNEFDNAFGHLRDSSQIKISDEHSVSSNIRNRSMQQWSVLPHSIL